MIDLDELLNQKPTFRQRARWTWNRVRNMKYTIKDFFFPWNKIKIQNLPRSWRDRDDVLFHAMHQIFIDFIELEHPLVPWNTRRSLKGRYTDYNEMVKFVEDNYGPNRDKSNEEEHDQVYADKVYLMYMEWLWMYKWYKDREWDDCDVIWDTIEEEQAFKKICDDKLHRIVAWRHFFWT